MFKPIRTIVETIVKLATFLHSDVFTAFWSFPSCLDHHLIQSSPSIDKIFRTKKSGKQMLYILNSAYVYVNMLKMLRQ